MANFTSLENGIQVVTTPLQHTRAISLGIVVDASPRNEPEPKAGIAHLAEHMVFQGTGSRSAEAISLFMDRSGGSMGAFTTRDYTFFGATILDEYLPFALELLGDILLNAIFPLPQLEREKQAILAEIAHSQDEPQSFAQDYLKQNVWGNHPLGRPIAGTLQTVPNLTREDLIYFVGENYLPDRMIIAAAGNLNHDDFCAQTRDNFWRMIGKSSRARFQQPLTVQSGIYLYDKPLHQFYFCLGFPAPPYTSSKRLALHLLTKLIASGQSSRLFQLLRAQKGLVYYVDAEYHAYRDQGQFLIEGCCSPEVIDQVLKDITNELRSLQNGSRSISEEELHTARISLRSQFLLESEQTSVQMSRLATQTLYFGTSLASNDILNAIQVITVEEINDYCKFFLEQNLGNLSVAIIGPCRQESLTETQVNRFIN